MVDAAEIDAADRLHAIDEAVHAGDVAGDEKSGAWVGRVPRVIPDRAGDVGKVDLHLGRNGHSIELFLPVTRCDQVIDENQKANIERLAPTDDDLAVNETVVDDRSEEHTSELQSRQYLVCRLLL